MLRAAKSVVLCTLVLPMTWALAQDPTSQEEPAHELLRGSRNLPPIVDAGGAYSGIAGRPIPLLGKASDPDGGVVSLQWRVTGGCSLSNPQIKSPILTCPSSTVANVYLKGTDAKAGHTTDVTRATVCDPDWRTHESGHHLPSIRSWAKIDACNQSENDRFGAAVALATESGVHTAIVGMFSSGTKGVHSRGEAHVLTRPAGENSFWGLQDILVASDADDGDGFGDAVALHQNTAIVGAPNNDDQCPADRDCDSGSAYVFVREAGKWTEQAKLVAPEAARKDLFGFWVAIAGDQAFVGAPGAGEGGKVFVYIRSGETWTYSEPALEGSAGENFGFSGSVAGTTLVVGSPATAAHTGAAYVFDGSSGGWTLEQPVKALAAEKDDNFGHAVLIRHGYLVIGAPWDNDRRGSARVFTKSDKWVEHTTLSATAFGANESKPDSHFGASLGLYGARISVGAPNAPGTPSGGVYIFEAVGQNWAPILRLHATGGGLSPQGFGWALAVESGLHLIGAPFAARSAGTTYSFDVQ